MEIDESNREDATFSEQTNKSTFPIQQQDSVELIDDDDDVDDNDEDEEDVIMSMNQDSIFSSVDLIDVDSCSKLDISALVPDDGDEMIGELNNGHDDSQQSINSSFSSSLDQLKSSHENKDNHRSHTKLKPTSSVYRQLLQKGHVRCDSNNLYEHLRRCEKMKTSLTKFRRSTNISTNQIVFQNFLLSLLKRLEMKDPQKLFAWPVIDSLTPGYSQVVKHPMDFNTIRKKIEHNIYQSVAELKYDVRLLCENAIRYYCHSGMHYCEASRLWYFAKTRIFARDQLAEHLKQFPPLTISDLGMDEPKFSNKMNGTQSTNNSTIMMTNGVTSKYSENLSLKSLLNDTKCEPSIVDYRNGFNEEFVEETPQQILEQHQQKLRQQSQTSSSSVELTLSRLQNNNNIIFERQKEDGTTTLPFIVNDCNDADDNQITLGDLAGARLTE
ncbi:bromodomain containing 7-like protein, partial [Euroglyphus maynei]